jgi:hypothetical protein
MKLGVPVENQKLENFFCDKAFKVEFGLKTLFIPS